MAQAAAGYAIGALLKYVDAIGQVFADVIAMLITVSVSTLLFSLDANFLYAIALFLSAASLVVYYSDLIVTAVAARQIAQAEARHYERQVARQIELVPKADAS